MKPADEEDYRSFVAVRLEPLRRMAYLLCRDWHTADDLVSITIGKLYRHWRRVSAPLTARPGSVRSDAVADRLALLDLLAQLPARRRAVVVLRFYCDLSVEETAEILGIAEGTVKRQAARGLETLRLLATDQYARQEF